MLVSVSDFSQEALQNIINVPKIDASSELHYLEEFNWSYYSMKYRKMPFFFNKLKNERLFPNLIIDILKVRQSEAEITPVLE